MTTLNVYGGARSNAPISVTMKVTYSDGTTDENTRSTGQSDWYWVSQFLTAGKSVSRVDIIGGSSVCVGGVSLGDNNLITGNGDFILTLTDRTDLDNGLFVGQTDLEQPSAFTNPSGFTDGNSGAYGTWDDIQFQNLGNTGVMQIIGCT